MQVLVEMKAVIQYAYPPEPDGLSLQGHYLYLGMKENGEDVLPCNPGSDLEREWKFRHFKPDIAIGVGYWGNTPELIIDPMKFSITPVPWLVADGWIANYQGILNSLRLILTTSEWVKQTYIRDGVKGDNIVPMHIGMDTELFRPMPKNNPEIERIRRLLSVREDEKMILTIGGDTTSKGSQEMLKALKIMDEQFPNYKYVMKSWPSEVSEGHRMEEEKLIEELDIDRNKLVFLDGAWSNDFMPYILNAADIYAAPSRLEGFGMIQVEAMACGIPVISIDEMGPKETIVHDKTGFLAKVKSTVELEGEWVYPSMGFDRKYWMKFPKKKVFAYRADEDELAEYTLKLLQDDSLRQEMGNNARQHAVENFNYKMISKKIADLIKERLDIKG